MPLFADIPQTDDLVNEEARVLDQRAPALTANTSVMGAHVRQAEREYQKRKVMHELNAGVTADEVSNSKRRQLAVEIAGVFDHHGPALRGGPITRDDLDRQTEQITKLITGQITRLTALVQAENARRYNATVLASPTAPNADKRLKRIPKMNANAGPNQSNVGDPCPHNLFPANVARLLELSRQQVEELATWYNDDFGITKDDDDAARREKFITFITWG